MKRYTYIIIFLFLSLTLVAQEYSIDELYDKACLFFAQSNSMQQELGIQNAVSVPVDISSLEAIERHGISYMYVANRADSMGWVILSNERQYTSIIGHSNYGSFSYSEDLPPALLLILEKHMNAIDSTRLYGAKNVSPQISPSSGIFQTKCFLGTTSWDQSGNRNGDDADCAKVYNKYMPTLFSMCSTSCNKPTAGCGAIAVAQVMRYWRWPDYVDVAEKVIMGVGYGTIRSWFDWDAMVDTLANNIPIYNVDAVAGLIRDAANGLLTYYTDCLGSAVGKTRIARNIQENLLYTSKLYDADDVNSDSLLRAEIDAKRPVIVQAWDGLSAHTFVVDGYQIYPYSGGEVMYSVNFGWGGSMNNYYDLDSNGYDSGQSFVTLHPDCSKRQGIVSIDTAVTISNDAVRTYYSSTNVNVCTRSNNVIVQREGHLTIKAGQQIVLKPGFHAKQGSHVLLTIATPCDDAQITGDKSSRHSLAKNAETSDNTTEPTWEANAADICTIGSNNLMDTDNTTIDHIVLYNASGQLLQIIYGNDGKLSDLPCGLYILQKHMTDGSVVSETIAKC